MKPYDLVWQKHDDLIIEAFRKLEGKARPSQLLKQINQEEYGYKSKMSRKTLHKHLNKLTKSGKIKKEAKNNKNVVYHLAEYNSFTKKDKIELVRLLPRLEQLALKQLKKMKKEDRRRFITRSLDSQFHNYIINASLYEIIKYPPGQHNYLLKKRKNFHQTMLERIIKNAMIVEPFLTQHHLWTIFERYNNAYDQA